MTATLMAAQGKTDVALKMVEPIIAAHDKIIADEKRQVYGARTQTETLVYLMMPGPNKEGVIVMGASWGAALYIKGYALIDLQRGDEADHRLSLLFNGQWSAQLTRSFQSKIGCHLFGLGSRGNSSCADRQFVRVDLAIERLSPEAQER